MLKGTESEFDIQTDIQNVNLYNLHLSDKYPEHRLNTNINAIFTGNDIDNIEGDILVSNTRFTDNMGEGIKIEHFDITSRPKAEGGKYMTLNSDFVNGYIDGDVNFSNMLPEIREIAAIALPRFKTTRRSMSKPILLQQKRPRPRTTTFHTISNWRKTTN